ASRGACGGARTSALGRDASVERGGLGSGRPHLRRRGICRCPPRDGAGAGRAERRLPAGRCNRDLQQLAAGARASRSARHGGARDCPALLAGRHRPRAARVQAPESAVPGLRRARMPRHLAGLFAACGLFVARAGAQAPPAEEPVEEVVVTGEFPGPGMWRVTRPGDVAGHEMWIVGDPPPLPKRMKWKAREVESVALRAQEILQDASVRMDPDEKIGLFRGLSQLPPELYARWLVQKKRYLGSDSGIEKWRPIFAADKLRREAFDELDLRESG